MDIRPVNHAKGDTNRYCGPSAISIVTGMTSGQAARLLRHVTGKSSIKGTYAHEMIKALNQCGITTKAHRVQQQPAKVIRGKTETRPTLTQWLRDSKTIRTPGRVFLISAGHHWQIVSGRRFCCGRTKQIVSITDKSANRRARVKAVYELIAHNGITTPTVALKKPTSTTICPYRKRLRDLEKELGFKGRIERDGDWIDYVVAPSQSGPFPHGLSTMHHGWDDTYGRVLHCTQPEVYASLADNNYHYSE